MNPRTVEIPVRRPLMISRVSSTSRRRTPSTDSIATTESPSVACPPFATRRTVTPLKRPDAGADTGSVRVKRELKLFLLLVLTALLLATPPALATAPAPPASVSSLEDELEFEAEEDEASEAELAEEECSEGQEEAAAGEIDQEELEEDCEKPSPERKTGDASCPLHSASAHAATSHNKLKVTLGYTTNEPFEATIQIKKGSTHQAFKRHLGRSGVLRFVLDDKQDTGQTVLHIRPAGSTGCPSPRLVLFPR